MIKVIDGVEVEMTPEEVAEWEAQQNATPTVTLQDYVTALTNHLDATARTKNYDNRITCAVRAGYPGPFQAEGVAFATWMDIQNFKGYQILEDVQGSVIQQPTIAEFLAMLDPMVWPA